MSFSLKTGSAGEEYYQFEATATPADVDRAYVRAWEAVEDEVGTVSPAKLASLLAFKNARIAPGLPAQTKAYLDAAIARMNTKVTEITTSLRVGRFNTMTAFCFRNLGYGVVIPLMTLDVPRSVPGIIMGWSAQGDTIKSIGMQQMSYVTMPLVDTNTQTPTYASFGGPITQNWVPLTWMRDEFDRACHQGCTPEFIAGRIWYPKALISLQVVQTKSVGDLSVPGQDHAIGIDVVTSFTCVPDPAFQIEKEKYSKFMTTLRRQLGIL